MSDSDRPENSPDGAKSRVGVFRNSELGRTFLWFLLWLVLSNLASQLLGFYWWNPYTFPKHTATLELARGEFRDTDVMVIGSSFARWNIASPALGKELSKQTDQQISVFNCGAPGVLALDARVRARILLEYATPRLLLYPLSIDELVDSSKDPHQLFYNTHASPVDLLTIDLRPPASYRDIENIIYGAFRPAQLPFQWSMQRASNYRKTRDTLRNSAGWFRQRKRTNRQRIVEARDWLGSERSWHHLMAIQQMADDRDCLLVIVRMPYDPNSKNLRFTNRAMKQFTDELDQFCADNSITMINLQQNPPLLEPADYDSDGRHLMMHGAEKLTRILAPSLAPLLVNSRPDGSAPSPQPN